MIQLDLPLVAPRALVADVPGAASPSVARRSQPASERTRPAPSARPLAAMARLAKHLGRRLGARRKVRELNVVWNRRMRTALGRAHFAARTIELNPTLLDRHPEELLPTLVHELCHLVAGVRAKHGPKWREAMRALGAAPTVCHRLDVSDLTVRRRAWLWRCTGCGESYRRRRRDAHRYRCGKCGRRLRVEASSSG